MPRRFVNLVVDVRAARGFVPHTDHCDGGILQALVDKILDRDEGYSGKGTKRPEYIRMMEDARRRRFNILLVWKFDRLSRSTRDLLNTVEELKPLGADFISYENQIDTTTPSGKLFFTIVAAFAQFEREIIRERVIAGLENAKSKGKVLGRPRPGDSLINQARELRKQGMSYRQIGKKLDIHES